MVGGWSRVIQDRYRVDRELGHRGHISTWLVTDLKSVSPCVLKCLREAEAPTADARLFEAQARILGGLDHPGLPRFVEYFVEGEGSAREHILITRYHPGESLDRLVAKGRLFSESQAVGLLRRLLPILAYLHDFDPPLVHRSLKAANLIVGPDGRPCLNDLNFAVEGEGWKAWEEAPPEVSSLSLAAPEVALGGAVPASDIYALGLLMLYAMSGRDPAGTAQEGGRQRIREATRAGEAFAAILARMVEPSLERRYADARDIEADLARFGTGRGPAAPPPAPPLKVSAPPPPVVIAPSAPGGRGEEPRRDSRPRLVALVVIVALAAAMLWFNATRRAGPPGGSLLPPPPATIPAVPTQDAAPAEAPEPSPVAPAPGEAPPAPMQPAAAPEKPAGGAEIAALPSAPGTTPVPSPEPSEQSSAPPVATAPPEATPVVAEGRLLFDGQPVTRLTSLQPTFWFRNEAKGTPEKPQVDYRDGAFRIRGLPAGRMGMSMRINLQSENPSLYPGDLDAWTTFVVGEGTPPALEVNLRKVMRLLQPADNNRVIPGWDVPCGGGSVLPGRVLFAWEPLDPAATYEIAIERLACGRNYASAGKAFKTSTAEAWVKVELEPSAEGECYSFRLSARKDGRPIGMLTTHGRDGLGWDYRFTVK